MSTRHIAAEDARLHDLTPEASSRRASKRFRQKLASDGFTVDEGFSLKPGYLYTVVRAISARVNQNWDGWPSEELKKSYKTFIGKPVFVNHENHDPTKARGVVVAARYVENGMDKYIEVVQEIDAGRFPKLAHEIKTGGLDSVSMGAEAGFTICSYCHNKAAEMEDMCDHVLNHKGKTLSRLDRKTGKREDVLIFESCHKISFFELSYVFEPADETAVASKVVVAGKRTASDDDGVCDYCGYDYNNEGHAEDCGDYLNDDDSPLLPDGNGTIDRSGYPDSASDRDVIHDFIVKKVWQDPDELHSSDPRVMHERAINEAWQDPDENPSPFDPRTFGASTSRPHTPYRDPKHNRPRNKSVNDNQSTFLAVPESGDGGEWENDNHDFDPRTFGAAVNLSRNLPYVGHNIPVNENNYYRSLNANSFDDLFDHNGVMSGNGRGGTDNLSFMRGHPLEMYTNGITKSNMIVEGDPRLPISHSDQRSGYSYVPQLDRSSVESGATPLRVWMRKQVDGQPLESVHQWDKVFDSFPADDAAHKSAGKYTKEDFAAAGSRKPWEKAEPSEDEEAIREIEAMIHKHSGECIPGVNCRGTGLAQGEQISKDSPNNPVNQKSSDPNGTGGLGGAGTPSSGGYQGNGKSGRDGLNPGAQSFYDQLAKDFPGASMGGFNPVVDQPWDEHATGDALDFMTSDINQGNTIRDRALANGAKHVIWQQKLWYPGGGVEDMDDRGSPTENHYDHVHINMGGASPTGGSSASAKGGTSAPAAPAASPMMQATPTGLVPTQRAAMILNPTNRMPDGGSTRTAAFDPALVDPNHPQHAANAEIVNKLIPGFLPEPGAYPIDPRKEVFVHTNRHAVNHNKRVAAGEIDAPLRDDVWSIKQTDKLTPGKVKKHVRGYAPELHLINNRLNVQEAGAKKFKETEERVVHAGSYGYIAPPPDESQDYSLMDYHPGFHKTFVHRDNGEPAHTADRVHFTPDARMYGAQADNWGRDHEPQLILEPMPMVDAANLHTIGGEPGDRPPTWQGHTASLKRAVRKVAMKKIARSRAMKLAFGETEAPIAVDTLREEGSAPEDDNDDFERYVDSPKDLQTPDFSQARQVDREQELQDQGGDMGQPGAADPYAQAQPQEPQQQYITLQVPMPAEAPQVPQAAVPAQAQAMPPQQQMPITASTLDYFDSYYGRRVANWMDAIEAGRGMTPEEVADYRRQAGKLSTLENGRELSTINRNPTKGTATMARSTNASRSKVARAGRRQHLADGPLVDGGDRSRNDQGEQEEAFISQTPPEGRAEVVTDDTQNISNTEHNLVARVQRGREQLLRDAKALAAVQRKRAFDESGGPTADVVDPRVNAGAGAEELTGDGFVSADPNEGVVPTNPKDASLRAFAAFDSWLSQKTGSSSRRHSEASIKKAAAAFSREAGISPQALFPALGIVLREARKNDKQANTRGAKMRKRSNESLDVAAPDARVDVETPVKNTDAAAQASQFDIHDFGNNAGDNVANPDLSTDQNWAPGEASKTSARVKTAGGLLAMRCAEGMIAAGLESNSRERKYQLAAEFEQMNRGLIQDRVALLERFAAVRQADLRRVASGSSRGAARSPIPAGLGGGTRTASAGMRTAAHDPSNDSSLFI